LPNRTKLPIVTAIAVMLLLLFPARTSAQSAPSLPAWMAGAWCSPPGGPRIEEVWLAPGGGIMLGMSRTVTANQRRPEFEFLRIEMSVDVPTYVAQPQGGPATSFRQTAASDTHIRFENPEHDFPKRVEYRRTGSTLHAEIAGPGRDGKERVIGFDYVACDRRS
jgi:hypothetical protein